MSSRGAGTAALIGGVGLYVFVALAVAMNVGGYSFSDRLALQLSRAKRVEPGTRRSLEAMVQGIARRADFRRRGCTRSPRSSRTRSRRAATLGTPRSRSPRAWFSLAALEPAV